MKKAGGSRGMLPQKILKNVHIVEAILVLFEHFLRKFCLNFLPLNLSVSNIMHFAQTFSIMCALSVRFNVIKKVQNYGEIVFIEDMFKNGWWGDASSTPAWIRPCPH